MPCCIAFSRSSFPSARIRRPFRQTITGVCEEGATCTGISFTGTLPPGLTFNSSDCVATISGVPTRRGCFTFQLTLSSVDCPDVVQQFTICVLGVRRSVGFLPFGVFPTEPIGRPNACGGRDCDASDTCIGGKRCTLRFYGCVGGACAYEVASCTSGGGCGSSTFGRYTDPGPITTPTPILTPNGGGSGRGNPQLGGGALEAWVCDERPDRINCTKCSNPSTGQTASGGACGRL